MFNLNVNKLLGICILLLCQFSQADTQLPLISESKSIEVINDTQANCLTLIRKNDNPTLEDNKEQDTLENNLEVDAASKLKQKLVSDCISKLRNDNDDQSFHTLVAKELRNTKYWNDSANWLKKIISTN